MDQIPVAHSWQLRPIHQGVRSFVVFMVSSGEVLLLQRLEKILLVFLRQLIHLGLRDLVGKVDISIMLLILLTVAQLLARVISVFSQSFQVVHHLSLGIRMQPSQNVSLGLL